MNQCPVYDRDCGGRLAQCKKKKKTSSSMAGDSDSEEGPCLRSTTGTFVQGKWGVLNTMPHFPGTFSLKETPFSSTMEEASDGLSSSPSTDHGESDQSQDLYVPPLKCASCCANALLQCASGSSQMQGNPAQPDCTGTERLLW